MTASGDITVAQNSQGHVKLHPYLVALVRWCVSCLWSTATVLLQRLMTAPLPITGPKPPLKGRSTKRAAGTDHLHPEPRVECELLHQPQHHTLDVIFVHGLYGSLGNTWRQGEWRQKYQADPKKVTLRNYSSKRCQCHKSQNNHIYNENNDDNLNECNDSSYKSQNTYIHDASNNDNLNKCNDNSYKSQTSDMYYGNIDHNQNKCNCNLYKSQSSDIYSENNDVYLNKCNCNSYKSQNTYLNNEHSEDKQNKSNYNSYKCQNNYIYNENSDDNQNKCNSNDDIYSITDLNDSEMTLKEINEKLFKKIIPKDNDLITEQFYNNTLLDQVEILDNYDTQAKFVRDLFKRENVCDNNDNGNKCKYEITNEVNECKCDKKCEVGCGCVCDDCYSSCWPRDWIKEDFPGARVISINYTSDPYLWRPLWIKENKRLSLHVRAEQMMLQLLDMGVGSKPIIWVGHSKGGLFIKQIYCKAYEAYETLNKTDDTANIEPNPNHINQEYKKSKNDDVIAETIDNIVGSMFDNQQTFEENNFTENSDAKTPCDNEMSTRNNYDNNCLHKSAKIYNDVELNENDITSLNVDNVNICNDSNGDDGLCDRESSSSNTEESGVCGRASLYARSRGFMFYSVPHRGSPLADIKTPVTARSLELLEITKDCPLVLELQGSWLAATGARGRRPAVRGFVETCRTLMSVLWLRIVSVHSADAGLGTLLGVSVDHREICKPSSRTCLLYTELTDLIHEALDQCHSCA